ncbi:MAG: WG repeat-containing protein [Desulfobulbaceae bacterium]|nr:WG repeat-containing protein [Desulfobulbaceae bacterium]
MDAGRKAADRRNQKTLEQIRERRSEAMNPKMWAIGLVVLIIGMGLQGCGSSKNPATMPTLESSENKTDNLVPIQINQKYGYINTKGEIAITPKFEEAWGFAANGLALIKESGKIGYVNTQGKMVIPPRFEEAWGFAANGLAQIVENRKYGYINAKGEMAIPPKFENIGDFAANSLAWIEENGKYGYINTQGHLVIAPRFEGASDFAANGLASVRENGKVSYINAQGQVIVSVDTVCGVEVLKNGQGEITWPKKTSAQICEEQKR